MKCVYCLDFPDGKRYVGSTKDLKQRMLNHRSPSYNKKSNPELREAISRGGYEVVIIEQCPDDYSKKQLEVRETHYIGLWWDYGILYNKYKFARGGGTNASGKKGKKYSPAYQRADEIRVDRAAGMTYHALRVKYKTDIYTIKDIVYDKP
jgi:group I intron endonuclease